MSMDPLKRLISIAGVILLFTLLYSVFSAFFTDVEVNQQFLQMQPNNIILFTSSIETASTAQSATTGTLFYISYQKGKVLYFENLSMRTSLDVNIHFSKSNTYRDGPLLGPLLASRGNLTLYMPSDTFASDYDYVVFWSAKTRKVVAYVNLTGLD